MNVNRIDLNLLVYLDALLRERNVTQAANQLNLSRHEQWPAAPAGAI